MRYITQFLLGFFVFLVTVIFAEASQFTILAPLVLHDVSTTLQNNNTLSLDFFVKNITESSVSNIKYGIHIQDAKSNFITETLLSKQVAVMAHQDKKEQYTIPLPKGLEGEYKIFLVARSGYGEVSALRYINTYTLHTGDSTTHITSCSVGIATREVQ